MIARFVAVGLVLVLLSGWVVAVTQLPGAGALLHPSRRPLVAGRPSMCQDVVAYDSRAHGESDGDTCTYGFFEKDDLHRILDTVGPGPIVLIGTSLGGAVAPQEAAHDPRVTAVVAAETFSDLRTVATERAPVVFTSGIIARAFRVAEQQGGFSVDDVSPVAAAADIRIAVLLIHGAVDSDTRPDHSRRVLAALKGPKRLILVPGAHHNESLTGDVWREVERWVDEILGSRPL